jgi:hypothetical protein
MLLGEQAFDQGAFSDPLDPFTGVGAIAVDLFLMQTVAADVLIQPDVQVQLTTLPQY